MTCVGPPLWMRRARLQRSGDCWVERRDRNRDPDQIVARHVGEQIDVAKDAIGLGRDDQRMPRFGQHLDNSARHAPFALDRLIAVGVGADGERGGHIAALGQLLAEQGGGIGLGKEPALEIEPRRQVVEGVGGAREAIDAAMFAAAIDVDRPVKGQIGRPVVGDQAAGDLGPHLGPDLGDVFLDLPSVVDGDAVMGFKAARLIGADTPSPTALRRQDVVGRQVPAGLGRASHAPNMNKRRTYARCGANGPA